MAESCSFMGCDNRGLEVVERERIPERRLEREALSASIRAGEGTKTNFHS